MNTTSYSPEGSGQTSALRLSGKVAIVSGATDGIGAATALLLEREGATVIGLGRSREKAAQVERLASGAGRLTMITADLSSMRAVLDVAREITARATSVDVLIHCMGILLPRAAVTGEGIEANFATSYLARFLLTRELLPLLEAAPAPVLVNVAASAPRIPSFARVDLGDLDAVRARRGMRGHGQAQLANDVFVAELGRRSRVVTVGYGPGSVESSIRRELPSLVNWLLRPLFARRTRTATMAATDLLNIVLEAESMGKRDRALYFDRGTPFSPDPFVTEEGRGQALFRTSEELVIRALAESPGRLVS